MGPVPASAWDPDAARLSEREHPLLSWDTGVCMPVTFTEEVPSSGPPGQPHQAEWDVPECFPLIPWPRSTWVGGRHCEACFFCKGWREPGLFLHHHSLHAAHTVLAGEQGWGTQALGRHLAPRPAPDGAQGVSTGGPAGPAHPPLNLPGWGLPQGCFA